MEQSTSSFQDFLNFIPSVNPERNYWLVRTSAGSNYADFISGNYIAIGWNEVTAFDLHQIKMNPTDKILYESIRDKVVSENKTDDEEYSKGTQSYQSRSMGQLLKFVYEIKKGDIVVIPSYNSDSLSFGEVLSTPLISINSSKNINENCTYEKRKRVKWLKKGVSRNSLESNLYKFIFAHQTVNNITEYSDFINNFLFDFYQVDGNYSLVLRVRSDAKIGAFAMNQFYSDLVGFINENSDAEEMQKSENSLSVKFDLQSPGIIVFVGIAAFAVAFLSIAVLTILAGGENNIEIDPETKKFKWNFKANSLLEKWSSYLDNKDARVERRYEFEEKLKEKENERVLRLMEKLKLFNVSPNKDISEFTDSIEVITEVEGSSNESPIDSAEPHPIE
jgi:hypothetical protein